MDGAVNDGPLPDSDPGISPDEVRIALREIFTDRPGVEEVRRYSDASETSPERDDQAGFDRARWSALCEQVGLAAVAAPGGVGGLGLNIEHAAAAVEECARTLYPGPVRAAALIGWCLSRVNQPLPEALTDAVESMFGGEVVPGWSPIRDVDQLPVFENGRLTGTVGRVTHGPVADLVLCEANSDTGPVAVLAAVPADASRVVRAAVDLSTPRADIVVDAAVALAVSDPGNGSLARTRHAGGLLLAAEQVGGSEGCLASMVSYAAVREQFGERIGTYQAIQHRCAETAIDIAAARALVTAGVQALNTHEFDAAQTLALLAGAEAATCFQDASSSLIQISGGVGFTWEHDAHLYFRRARATASAVRSPERLRHAAVEGGCVDLLNV